MGFEEGELAEGLYERKIQPFSTLDKLAAASFWCTTAKAQPLGPMGQPMMAVPAGQPVGSVGSVAMGPAMSSAMGPAMGPAMRPAMGPAMTMGPPAMGAMGPPMMGPPMMGQPMMAQPMMGPPMGPTMMQPMGLAGQPMAMQVGRIGEGSPNKAPSPELHKR